MKRCLLTNGNFVDCLQTKAILFSMSQLSQNCLQELYVNVTSDQSKIFKTTDQECQKKVEYLDLVENGQINYLTRDLIKDSIQINTTTTVTLADPIVAILGDEYD